MSLHALPCDVIPEATIQVAQHHVPQGEALYAEARCVRSHLDAPDLCHPLFPYRTPSGSPGSARAHPRAAMCRRARGGAGGGCRPGAA